MSYNSSAHKLLSARAQNWNIPFQPLGRSKCWKEDRQKDNWQTCEESPNTIWWFYVLFNNASIAIGSDEMIGKECSFVHFSIGLLEISTEGVP